MKNCVLLFVAVSVGAVSTLILPPVQAQSTNAASVKSLKAANQRLESKIRSMQAEIDFLQEQLQMSQLHPKIGSALPDAPNGGSLNLNPFQTTPFYQPPTYQVPTYPSPGSALPDQLSPTPPRLYNIPDSRVVLLSQSH